jgi:hypothetical protein
MELFKVALEKGGDCHVKQALTPHNVRILLHPFPSCSSKLPRVREHRIMQLPGQVPEKWQ